MKWYCEKCKKLHDDGELCPKIKSQLAEHPKWVADVTNFIVVAGAQALISGQLLDKAAQGINKLVGTNLSYEGTRQFARDIQVFKRLAEEPFSRSGVFSSPESAKGYLENEIAKDKPRALTCFESKLTGYGQETDWLREKHGQISRLWQKSTLLKHNAPGIDGTTVNRFTGKEISRTTIKASKNVMTRNSTGIKDVKKAIEKGTATEKDIIYGPKGTAQAARDAGLKNPVIEKNTAEQIQNSNKRLEQKILDGQATTSPTLQQVGSKMAQGAIVGAAVAVTVSSISTYVRYKNGEIDREEAFKIISEETVKGTIIGAGMAGVGSIFLVGSPIGYGYVAGMAIGVYFSKLCTNIFDEVFGKGAYGAILNASGYVYGMTFNLAEYYQKIKENNEKISDNIEKSKRIQEKIESNFNLFENMKEE